MLWINKNGVKKIINRAEKIMKENNFQLLKNDELKNKFLNDEFKICWED